MVRPKNIEMRVSKLLSFDADYYKEFEELVGHGNVSEEIRTIIKERVEQSKKEKELANDPLKLMRFQTQESDNNNRNIHNRIFEDFDAVDKRMKLREYVDSQTDMNKLNVLYYNCRSLVGMIEQRKIENKAVGNIENRVRNEKALEDHFVDMKKAKYKPIKYRGQNGEIKRI